MADERVYVTWACTDCGAEFTYERPTGGQYPYTDIKRPDALMCRTDFFAWVDKYLASM